MITDAVVVLVTAPDMDRGVRIGQALVEEQLAACANIVPGLCSMYRWQGTIHDEAEVLLLIKTTLAAQAPLTQRVLDLDPYDTPALVALPIVVGRSAYLGWIVAQTANPSKVPEAAA